jgi:signal peptidase I
MDQTKRRNPIIAFLLSIVLPGLGHVYNGRLLQGILLFFGWWLVLIVLGFSGLVFSLWGLICFIVAGIVCQILIATHAAIEAAHLKVVPLKWYNKWYIYVCTILLVNHALAAAIPLAQRHLVGARGFRMTSSPMVPALEEGDHFIAKLEKYGDRLPRRGDIIVFPYPEDRSKNFVERVIGLPGERLEIRDKAVFINDKRLQDPWGVHESNVTFPIAPRDNFGPVEVPEGEVFVLGDNRDFSRDSRFWGYVRIKDIEGKAIFIYWSNDRNRIGKQLR